MKSKTGKYMFVGNINGIFGPKIIYSDALKQLKLSKSDKNDIKMGYSLLIAARGGKITRIYSNGNKI